MCCKKIWSCITPRRKSVYTVLRFRSCSRPRRTSSSSRQLPRASSASGTARVAGPCQSVSQSVSYFTVPPRAHPSTGSQSGSATPVAPPSGEHAALLRISLSLSCRRNRTRAFRLAVGPYWGDLEKKRPSANSRDPSDYRIEHRRASTRTTHAVARLASIPGRLRVSRRTTMWTGMRKPNARMSERGNLTEPPIPCQTSSLLERHCLIHTIPPNPMQPCTQSYTRCSTFLSNSRV